VKILEAADLIFTLDFNALHRVGGGMEEVLSEMKAPFIMIDHHQNQMIMPLTAIRTLIGSTCEMLYNFISFLGKKKTSTKLLELVFIPEFLQIQAPLGFQEPQEIRTDCFRINRFRS
jgi:nanoRNase/pAp phosphatase (c-di-AMP/oligoRNAs hydrolase)